MKVPFTWLKDYVDIDCTPEELSQKLFSCGFEVEELIYLGKDIDRVVTARIEKIEKHPDADKLVVCQIDAGTYGKFQIVTGASNVFEGAIVPVALDKSTLPGGRITTGKLRGVVSQGMMCSGKELNITEADYEGASVNGILILREDTPVGVDIKDVLGLNEYVLDIGVTANRPDCQSILGIAREVAAVCKKPLKEPEYSFSEDADATIGDYVRVDVEAPELCPRYLARAVREIQIAPSPEWMKKRLRLCGLRPINNVVDITNFVLLEMGQPMHAFDARQLGGRHIVVRRAAEGEKIVTLDGKESLLTPEMLVICDENKPVALAGIMGGLNSGIADDTSAIVFECAKFKRDSIRRTSKAVGVRSDSSARYEKGIDANSPYVSMHRALHLIQQLGAGKIVRGEVDVLSEKLEQRTITAEKSRIDALLGIDIPAQDMVDILNRLNIKTAYADGKLTCEIPLYREDIDGYPDLAEEIIRMYGYDAIRSTLLEHAPVMNGGYTEEQRTVERMRNCLCYHGCHEIVTYAFTSKKSIESINLGREDKYSRQVELINPLSEDIAVMRTSMLPGMLNVLSTNLSRKNEAGRFFEMGRVFLPKELPLSELPEEAERLSIAVYGAEEDFFTLKGIVELLCEDLGLTPAFERGGESYLHPNKRALVRSGKAVLGCLGELHPDVLEAYDLRKKVYYAELDLHMLLASAYPKFEYRNIPKFPGIVRDIAVVAEKSITNAQILEVIRQAGGHMLRDVKLFDLYEGDKMPAGYKSMAYQLSYRADDRTLKVEEADESIARILKKLEKQLGVKLR